MSNPIALSEDCQTSMVSGTLANITEETLRTAQSKWKELFCQPKNILPFSLSNKSLRSTETVLTLANRRSNDPWGMYYKTSRRM